MNAYEQRQAERKERLLKAAKKAKQHADETFNRVDTISKGIPFGQPILAGHHSERRHRADIKRIEQGMNKAIAETDKAKQLQEKAESVGLGGISSDDPDAIEKLQAKLDKLERERDMMKKINKAHARYLKNPALDLSEFTEKAQDKIRSYKPSVSWEVHPFPPYALTNIGARIRATRKRIERLQANKERDVIPAQELEGGIIIKEDKELNRIQIVYPCKPSDAVIKELKRHGFHWSRSLGVWQRKTSEQALFWAQTIAKRGIE